LPKSKKPKKPKQNPQRKITVDPPHYDMQAGGGMQSYTAFMLEKAPECAAIIGAICVEAAKIEQILGYWYSVLVLGYRQYFDGSEAIIEETFERLPIRTKRAFMLVAARRRYFADGVVDEMDDLLNDVQDVIELRGKLVHGHWGMSQKHPGKVVFHGRKWELHKAKLYSPQELMSVLYEMNRASSAFHGFFVTKMLPTLEAFTKNHIKFILDMEKREDGA
jgi:hypothetical protein